MRIPGLTLLRPPAARRRGAPRGGPEQPTFERPPCSGRPPCGKTHSLSSNHLKIQRNIVKYSCNLPGKA
jgi:hypothetical protein